VAAVQLITAVVPPSVVDEIASAVKLFGVRELIVTTTSSLTDGAGHSEIYRGVGWWSAFRDEARVEILASDEDAADIVSVIAGIGGLGLGEGCRVWMVEVREFVRVRGGQGTQVR
jgi:nitrogen regulatory protein P-II 1